MGAGRVRGPSSSEGKRGRAVRAAAPIETSAGDPPLTYDEFKAAVISNPSNGIAVDFRTKFDGALLKSKTVQRAAWRTTWLHPWLVENARTFCFEPLETEEWHWELRP